MNNKINKMQITNTYKPTVNHSHIEQTEINTEMQFIRI